MSNTKSEDMLATLGEDALKIGTALAGQNSIANALLGATQFHATSAQNMLSSQQSHATTSNAAAMKSVQDIQTTAPQISSDAIERVVQAIDRLTAAVKELKQNPW